MIVTLNRHGYHRRTEESVEDGERKEKYWKDIYQSNVIKYEEERVLLENLMTSERWREYYQKLMNEENPRKGRNEQQA